MKISYSIGFENGWQGRAKILSKLGFDGVELGIRDPDSVKVADLLKGLDKLRLTPSAIATGLIYAKDGLYLSSPERASRQLALSRLKKHIDLAGIMGAFVVIGLARGRKQAAGMKHGDYQVNLDKALKDLCAYAEDKDATLLLEPINRYETDFIHSSQDALRCIEKTGSRNMKLLLDTYHMNIEETDIDEAFIKAKEHLSYVHLADNNRMFPGQGHIDFPSVIKTLKKIGYSGYLSMEITPGADFERSARQGINYIRSLL